MEVLELLDCVGALGMELDLDEPDVAPLVLTGLVGEAGRGPQALDALGRKAAAPPGGGEKPRKTGPCLLRAQPRHTEKGDPHVPFLKAGQTRSNDAFTRRVGAVRRDVGVRL